MLKKVILPAIMLLLASGFWSCQEQIDIEAEKDAIKKLVQSQLDAVIAASYEGEAAIWAHTDYIVRKDLFGWDSISVSYQNAFQDRMENPDSNQITVFTASNFDIYVNGNFASVFHDEHLEGIWDGEEINYDGRPHKFFEKIDGEWKMIALL